jgi:hypothetical protein
VSDRPTRDPFGRYDPGRVQILAWAGIGILLYLVAEPLVVPYLVASMVLASTYIFGRNGYSIPKTLAWTIPTAAFAALVVASDDGDTWAESLLFFFAMSLHCAFFLGPRLRIGWYGGE